MSQTLASARGVGEYGRQSEGDTESHRHGYPQHCEEGQRTGLDAARRAKRLSAACLEPAGGLGQLGDEHRQAQADGQQEVDAAPESVDAANPTRQQLHRKGHDAQNHRVEHQAQRPGTDACGVGSALPDLPAVHLPAHPVGVEEEEGEPGDPVETRHQEQGPHGTLQAAERTKHFPEEGDRL